MKDKKLQIRISSGTAKNKKLKCPEIPYYRSVQEVAKQSVFSIIGEKVVGANCLDLYAGSGNLGLEALSRGAATCDFVDSHFEAIKVLKENVRACGFDDRAGVFREDAVKFVANSDKRYDIIFSDPFYDDINHIWLMKNLEEIVKKDGLVVFFHGDNLEINRLIKDTGLQIIDNRRFGKSYFTLINKG